jgi:hypothetical protein
LARVLFPPLGGLTRPPLAPPPPPPPRPRARLYSAKAKSAVSIGIAFRPRAEEPLHLNSPGEEPLQHEAGAEGLSAPALNPCGTHRGARVQLLEQARGANQRKAVQRQ